MLDRFIHKYLGLPYQLHATYDYSSQDKNVTIIFLHGIAADSHTWTSLIKKAQIEHAFDGARIIALDLLGYGRSPMKKWLRYDCEDHVSSIVRTIKKMHVRTPIILVGHSMGALLAISVAGKISHRVNGLVLVSPPFLLPKNAQKTSDKFYIKSFQALKDNSARPSINTIGRVIERFTSFHARYMETPAFSRSIENIILSSNPYKQACKIKAPTYIVHGKLDPLVIGANIRSVAKKNKNVKLCEVVAGHDVVGPKISKTINCIKEAVSNI